MAASRTCDLIPMPFVLQGQVQIGSACVLENGPRFSPNLLFNQNTGVPVNAWISL